MAKNKKIKEPLSGQITHDMLSRSKVDRFRDSTGNIQYSLIRNPLRRLGHWINPVAGYTVKPVGGWKYVDGVKCANAVVLKYQNRIIQKALIGLGIVGATVPAALEIAGTLQATPNLDNTPQEPTYAWVCNCNENCKCKDKDKDKTPPTKDETTTTTPSNKEDEGFVVETPTEEETTDQTDDGFNVNTTNPPAGTTGGTTTGTTTEKTETTTPSTTPTEEDAFKIPGVPGMLEGGSYQEDGPSQ